MNRVIALLVYSTLSAASFAQQSMFQLQGQVRTDKGKGIQGVVVNDGMHFTTTDAQGRWKLQSDTCFSKFIAISTPEAYELNNDRGLPGFYIPVAKAVKQTSNDFVLKKRRSAVDRFTYIAISDPQVRNADEMSRWKNETIRDLRQTIDSLKTDGEIVGMTLGDLVFDVPQLFPEYAASCQNLGMVMFQTIGNHDFDQRYQDLHNMRSGSPVFAEHNYFRWFGPTDYSFNIGKVHVITMKNINYVGRKKYIEAITDQQLDWLEKDLSYVAKGSVVFLNMHAAAWNTEQGEGNIRNASDLKKILKDYRVHVFCGHTHYYQNVVVNDHLYQHNISAACGAWWAGNVGVSGAPNGYLIVRVNGEDVRWNYKPTGESVSNQMRLYAPGSFRRDRKSLVANVWDYDPSCSVTWSEDGVERGNMEQFVSTDEMYIRQENAAFRDVDERPTGHLFRCKPSAKAKEIMVTFTNRFGEQYKEILKL
jgi:hypothetical protein